VAEEQNKTGPQNDPKRHSGGTIDKWVRSFLIGIDHDDDGRLTIAVANVQYRPDWDSSIVEDVHSLYEALMLLQVDETGAWVWSRVSVTHEVVLTAA